MYRLFVNVGMTVPNGEGAHKRVMNFDIFQSTLS